LGQGDDYVYHGKIEFIGIHTKDKLKLSAMPDQIIQQNRGRAMIFAEYYVIKVNQF